MASIRSAMLGVYWVVVEMVVVLLAVQAQKHHGPIRYFDWKIEYSNVTRLCENKTIVTLNGKFPGPTVYVREGDMIIVNVTNLVSDGVTIHWHGVRQLLSSWADGTVGITQCPIQTGQSYVHKFVIRGQRGTLFWHGHSSWLRATLYGAFIILPKKHVEYPFARPNREIPIVLGEWWKPNTEDVIKEALWQGWAYRISDALTINGEPGFLYNCSQEGAIQYKVTKGNRYLLRLINAAMNFQLYFSVTGHTLLVVEADGEYTKQFETDIIVLAPGESMNVLLTADQPIGNYYMAASVFSPAPVNPVVFPTIPASAVLTYEGAKPVASIRFDKLLPQFPLYNDTSFVANFVQRLKRHGDYLDRYYMDIPRDVDEDLLYTISYAARSCSAGLPCPDAGFRIAASMNNITFKPPTQSLLQAYYDNISGVFQTDFPETPLFYYNFTTVDLSDKHSVYATKVRVLDYNATVQIVFQDTRAIFFESHPIHLHGQSFYVVGTGFGTYNSAVDSVKFNLVDPPFKNTIGVPSGGWAAVRFRALNPGVWYMHCHLDIHNSWGMATAFLVKNGVGKKHTLPPPPSDLPRCVSGLRL